MTNRTHTKPATTFLKAGTGPIALHFAHANGYPPACYWSLFRCLAADCTIIAAKQRPLWGNQKSLELKSWKQLSEDQIRFLEEKNEQGVTAIGHSMGGVVSAMTAAKRPDLVKKLVLIDPVIFDVSFFKYMQILPVAWRKKIIPIAKIAAKRRDVWENQEAVYQSFRTKRIFKRIPDKVLREVVNGLVEPNENGQVRLVYPKSWETQVYATAPSYFQTIKKSKTPMLIVKGQYSDVITQKVWSEWQAAQPNNHFLEVPDTGHLLPFEQPKLIADWILEKL